MSKTKHQKLSTALWPVIGAHECLVKFLANSEIGNSNGWGWHHSCREHPGKPVSFFSNLCVCKETPIPNHGSPRRCSAQGAEGPSVHRDRCSSLLLCWFLCLGSSAGIEYQRQHHPATPSSLQIPALPQLRSTLSHHDAPGAGTQNHATEDTGAGIPRMSGAGASHSATPDLKPLQPGTQRRGRSAAGGEADRVPQRPQLGRVGHRPDNKNRCPLTAGSYAGFQLLEVSAP